MGGNASANAILTDNITVNEGVLDAVNKGQVSESDFIEWKPIGTYDSYDAVYTGTFDGKGYTISGLYFNHPDASYVGLFGYIGANGKISNVGVSDSYFQFRMKGGGVCGKNDKDGVLQNCSNSSTVIGKINIVEQAACAAITAALSEIAKYRFCKRRKFCRRRVRN